MTKKDKKTQLEPKTRGQLIGRLLDSFEQAAHADDSGTQYWLVSCLANQFKQFSRRDRGENAGHGTANQGSFGE